MPLQPSNQHTTTQLWLASTGDFTETSAELPTPPRRMGAGIAIRSVSATDAQLTDIANSRQLIRGVTVNFGAMVGPIVTDDSWKIAYYAGSLPENYTAGYVNIANEPAEHTIEGLAYHAGLWWTFTLPGQQDFRATLRGYDTTRVRDSPRVEFQGNQTFRAAGVVPADELLYLVFQGQTELELRRPSDGEDVLDFPLTGAAGAPDPPFNAAGGAAQADLIWVLDDTGVMRAWHRPSHQRRPEFDFGISTTRAWGAAMRGQDLWIGLEDTVRALTVRLTPEGLLPAATPARRVEALVDDAIGRRSPSTTPAAGVLPPFRTDSAAGDVLRRAAWTAEGRITDGLLTLPNTWRRNWGHIEDEPPYTPTIPGRAVVADIDQSMLTAPPSYDVNDALLTNTVHVTTGSGEQITVTDDASLAAYGPRETRISTYLDEVGSRRAAEDLLRRYARPFHMLTVDVDLRQVGQGGPDVTPAAASRRQRQLAAARPGGLVYCSLTGTEIEEGLYNIWSRRLALDAAEASAVLQLKLVNPRLFSLGWTLGVPGRDTIGVGTWLVSPSI